MRMRAGADGRRRKRPGCGRNWAPVLGLLVLLASLAYAEDGVFSVPQREQMIRAFLDEPAFAHCAFPRGKAGIRIEDGKISPPEADIQQLVERSGAAARPGARVKITGVRFVREGILFEINGGPTKRKKWQDHINVSNGITPATQPDESAYAEFDGSSVLLVVKDGKGIGSDQVKEMLAPVLDFKALTQGEAYQKSLPPVLAVAVKEHRALVGMDKEMVEAAMGRPSQRVRETGDGQEYEEWIYGTPPGDVEFVRMVQGKVVRIEDMKVTGEKRVRTQSEVGVLDSMAEKQARPDAMAAPAAETERKAPSLLRPGEKIENHGDTVNAPLPMPELTLPPSN